MTSINCTPIKPQVTFKSNEEEKYQIISEKTDKADEFIKTHDIKAPVAAAASVGLAALLAFSSGKRIGAAISKIAKNAPEVMDKAVVKAGKYMNTAKDKLLNVSDGKMVKVKNFAGKVLEKTSELGSKGYTKLQTIGLPKDATAAQMKANGFNNAFGVAALATIFPSFMTRDGNKNNLPDILENGQNTYTGQTTYDKTKAKMEGFYSVFQDVVEVLT